MYTKKFEQLNSGDVGIAGGKGASLGETTQAGILVPPGFVILAEAFEKFLEDTDLNVEIDSVLHSIKTEKINTIEDAAEKIQSLIFSAEFPKDIAGEILKSFKDLGAKFVAVRSSATAEDSSVAAWAGQLESYLNTTKKDLLENIKKCWASLFTPRAIFYRFEKELHKQKISVAVVVQKMVESEASGVAFSVHPITEDRNQLIIEAGFGLGEAIVAGEITPDSYVVEKDPRIIIDKNIQVQTRGLYRSSKAGNEWKQLSKSIGEKQVLSDKEILKLSEIILKIENHYGFPVDIEWAMEKDKIYIVQSRPITTLNFKNQYKKIKYIKEFARNYSLFQVVAYSEFNKRSNPELNVVVDTGLPLFIHDGGSLAKIYYPEGGVNEIFNRFGVMAADVVYFNGVVKRYLEVVDKIKPYFEKKKSVKNISELRNLYELYLDFSYGESAIWVAPLIKSLPDKLKSKALSVREKTQELTSLRDELFDHNLSKLFPELGELVHFVLPKSVFNRKTATELLKEAKKYKKGFVYFNNSIYTGQQDKILEKLNIGIADGLPKEKVNSIDGQSVSRGIARGRVKIVLTNKDIHKILKGDILVSPMTRPDFLPAMKKSAAFVTDEGGITCHAAIVAREMKKPCVIGAKIATQILKDGDLVEVDADKGIIRIIKEQKILNYIKGQKWFFGVRADESLFFYSAKCDGKKEYPKKDYGIEFAETLLIPLKKDYPIRVFNLNRAKAFHEFSKDKIFKNQKIIESYIIKDDNLWRRILSTSAMLEKFSKKNDYHKSVKLFKEIIKHYKIASAQFNIIFSLGLKLTENKDNFKKAKSAIQKHDVWRNSVAFKEEKMGKALFYFFKLLVSQKDLRTDPLPVMKFLTLNEVSGLLEGRLSGEKIDEIIKLRKKQGYIYLSLRNFGQETIDNLSEINSFQKYFLKLNKEKDRLESKNQISGQVAFSGTNKKIRGRVIVIRDKRELKDKTKLIKTGKILVAIQTTPHFIPYLKKVKAIITDEGGLTCHAAIVSREMKKPCIIGTKIATRILKDGDGVKIDFEKGVIEKIKPSKILLRKI